MNTDVLLNPKSVAIVGASGDPTRLSGIIVNQIRRLGFIGDVFPVNPNRQSIAGFPCLNDISELEGQPPEVAIIYLPAEAAVKVARDCGALGVKGLVVLSAGFSETGGNGRNLQEELLGVCEHFGMVMCGPNTAGLANFSKGFVAFGANGLLGLESYCVGGTAILTSSGGLGSSIFAYCQSRGVGVSHLIGMGNEAHTNAADYLRVLVEDENVSSVIALIESIREPERFFSVARQALAVGKPLLVMKQGRHSTGRRSIQTHTAAIAGKAEAVESALRANGVIVLRELQALADHAMLFERLPPKPIDRIGIFSLPGGGTSLLADAAEDCAFLLPALSDERVKALGRVLPAIATAQNPMDPTAGFGQDIGKLESTLVEFAAEKSFDAVVFFQATCEGNYAARIATVLASVAPRLGKPLICIWESGRELEEAWGILRTAEIPLFRSAQAGFRALASLRDYHRFQSDAIETDLVDEELQGPLGDDEKSNIGRMVAEGSPVDVFEWAGLSWMPVTPMPSANAAVQTARLSSSPIALKLEAPDLLHKSDIGGVFTNLETDEQVATAYLKLESIVTEKFHGRSDVQIVAQTMAPHGIEVLVGVVTDPEVGPMVSVGTGGALAELYKDVTSMPVPATRRSVKRMLDRLKVGALIRGFRGAPCYDEEALVDFVFRVAKAAHLTRHYGPEFEFNPVIVHANHGGAVAVDWVVRFNRDGAPQQK